MKKRFAKISALLMICLMIGGLLAGCGGGSTEEKEEGAAAPAKKVTINLAHVLPESAASAQACVKFKEIVEKETNGEIEVKLFPASALGNERDINENLNNGSLQMVYTSPGAMGAAFYPELQVLDAPFLFRDADHAMKAARGDNIMRDLVADLESKTNIKILDLWYRAPRYFYTIDKPIRTPDDAKGVKLRVPDIEIYYESLAALGFSVTPVAYGETYGALQQGIVQGLEGPMDLTWGMKFQEVTKYVSLAGWNSGLGPIAINQDFFDSLTPEQQEIIQKAAIEAGDYNTQVTLDGEKTLLQNFKDAGLEVVEPDLDAFMAKAKEAIPNMSDVWNDNGRDLYGQIQAIK